MICKLPLEVVGEVPLAPLRESLLLLVVVVVVMVVEVSFVLQLLLFAPLIGDLRIRLAWLLILPLLCIVLIVALFPLIELLKLLVACT